MTMVIPNTFVNGHHGVGPMHPQGLGQTGAVAAGEDALDAGRGPHLSLQGHLQLGHNNVGLERQAWQHVYKRASFWQDVQHVL
jgi:hypothetical protein